MSPKAALLTRPVSLGEELNPQLIKELWTALEECRYGDLVKHCPLGVKIQRLKKKMKRNSKCPYLSGSLGGQSVNWKSLTPKKKVGTL